jgi:class 3 adenylate cyclase
MGASIRDPRRTDSPIVGRAEELAVAERWIGLAIDGMPRIGIVRGDAGVGKSAFVRAVADLAERRGLRVLRTKGQEDVGPPLLPMLTMLLPLIDQALASGRADLTAADRDALAALAAASDQARESAPSRRRTDDTQRYLTLVRLLLGAARVRPLLLLVDDAHALDEASAGLLAHLAAAAAHAAEGAPIRLLTLLSVRRTPGRPTTLAAIARLAREEGAAVLELGGLGELGLNEMLTSLGPAPPSPPLLWSILRRTDGNPLFARLLWNQLLESGDAHVDRRVVVADMGSADSARGSLGDAVDIQLESLPADTRDVLTVAAVLGDGGSIAVLGRLTDIGDDDLEDHLTRADECGVAHIDGRRYRFDHPLLPAALTRRVSPRRRRRLHVDIAAALADIDPSAAVEIASHLRAGSELAEPDDRRRWGVEAAEQALGLGAWGDAAAGFALALDDGADAGFDPRRRLDLYLQAATASAADHDYHGAEHFGLNAIEQAREMGDLELWCEALAGLSHCRIRVAPGGSRVSTGDLEEFLSATEGQVPALRARAMAHLTEVYFTAFEFSAGLNHAEDARRLAEEVGDDTLIAFVSFTEGLLHQGHLDLDQSDDGFARSIVHADAAGGAIYGAWARARLPSARWIRGLLDEAETAAVNAEPLASATHDWAELSLIAAWRSNIAGAQGRFADAEALADRALVRHRRSDYAFTTVVAFPVLAVARAVRGDVGGAHDALNEWRQSGATRFADQLDILVDCLVGDRPAVQAALARRAWRPVPDQVVGLRYGGKLMAQVEVGATVGDRELLAAARAPLADLHHRGVRFVPGSLSLVSRLRGVAAGVDEPDDGLGWFAVARAEAVESGAEAEAARCDLDEAVLRRARGGPDDDEVAERLLASAAMAFDRLGMLPFLRIAEQQLGGRPDGTPRALKVILFTDLVDSTILNLAAGDEPYVQLLRVHDRVVRDALRSHGGVEFKHTGDGVAAWFASAQQAVRCALELQEHLTGLLHAESGLSVQIRCGLAAGEPIEERGDLFGIAVTRAKRICDEASGGEVLVAQEVESMVGDPTLRFDDHADAELKGMPGRTRLLIARRSHQANPSIALDLP